MDDALTGIAVGHRMKQMREAQNASSDAAWAWKHRADELEADLDEAEAKVAARDKEIGALKNKVADLERRLSEESKYLDDIYALLVKDSSSEGGLVAAFQHAVDRYAELAGAGKPAEELEEIKEGLFSSADHGYKEATRNKKETLTHYLQRFKVAKSLAIQRDLVKEAALYAFDYIIDNHKSNNELHSIYRPNVVLADEGTKSAPSDFVIAGKRAHKEAQNKARKNIILTTHGEQAQRIKDSTIRYFIQEHDRLVEQYNNNYLEFEGNHARAKAQADLIFKNSADKLTSNTWTNTKNKGSRFKLHYRVMWEKAFDRKARELGLNPLDHRDD